MTAESRNPGRAMQQQLQLLDHRTRLKVALWHTPNFRPLFDHIVLENIMSSLGFVGLPPSKPITSFAPAWREYVYPAGGQWRSRLLESQQPPKPRLPHPTIDGLHVSTYRAFINAVNFYLDTDVSAIFHVRGLPLQRADYESVVWCEMAEVGEHEVGGKCFLYRFGTSVSANSALYNVDRQRTKDRDNHRIRQSHREETSVEDSSKYHSSNLVPLANINTLLARRDSESIGLSMSLEAQNLQSTEKLIVLGMPCIQPETRKP